MTHKEVKQSTGSVVSYDSDTGCKKVEIVDFKEGSRTKVRVTDADRGKGWCESTQRYVGYTYTYRNPDADSADGTPAYGRAWKEGVNYGFGEEFVVHRDKLSA